MPTLAHLKWYVVFDIHMLLNSLVVISDSFTTNVTDFGVVPPPVK